MVSHETDPLQVSKLSPKNKWEFRYLSTGMVQFPEQEGYNLRFRVFAQYRTTTDPQTAYDDPGQWATRMLLRLWTYNYFLLGRDHSPAYRRQVDLYLCFGGDPGGEQLFAIDPGDLDSGNRPVKVDTMYIYQVPNITDQFQLCRELAHEYGHATFPAVGPFEKPEDWANGDLGERVFLNWLNIDIRSGFLDKYDAAKADPKEIQSYVDQRVTPLVEKVAHSGPELKTIAEKDAKTKKYSQASHDAYLALAVYAANILPPKLFNRAMDLAGESPVAFAKAVLEVGSESSWEYTIPSNLKGKAIYLPLGEARIDGAKVLAKRDGWVKVQPSEEKLVVTGVPAKDK